jgi:3-oxoacyl-[acyl-carrier-protein] synthase-3
MTPSRAKIIACGSYLPAKRVTNEALAEQMETSDEWIRTRTGICARHIVAEGETTADMAIAAAFAACKKISCDPKTIDLIIVATTTPARSFPATAVSVAAALGNSSAAAFDVQAVCAGFVYALILANSCLASGVANRALVIGADSMSRLVDWQDRSSAVLFGDGAGAVLLDKTAEENRGIFSSDWHADGREEGILYADGGVSSTRAAGFLRMDGKEVFRHAVEKMTASVEAVLQKTGLEISDIDLLVPHQANARILAQIGKRLGIAEERVALTLDQHANTSAASIPLALAQLDSLGKLKPGQRIILTALGGGLSWGSIYLVY